MIRIPVVCLLLALYLVSVTGKLPVEENINRRVYPPWIIWHFNPCWYKRCHEYAKCRVIKDRAVCVCPQNCTRERKPVCGTNWKTYNNLCELKAKSCSDNAETMLRYFGECKAGDCRWTHWQYLRCPYFSQCSLNYGLPSCSCPTASCSFVYKPVCGTNGKTYQNACVLRKRACKTRLLLRIRHRGHCRPDPCRFKKCCCRAQCRVNETNHARCECGFACPLNFDPVCGSDGRTYGNGCSLSSAACVRQDPTLVVVSNGACPTTKPRTSSPCLKKKCKFFAECTVVNDTATCVCPVPRPGRPNPVCGSDGVTYPHEHALRRAGCIKKERISIVKRGPCESPCDSVDCCCGGRCIVRNSTAVCECQFGCTEQYDPVCGTDGRTYGNECSLRRAACEKNNPRLNISSKGECRPTSPATTISPCAAIRCGYYATCEVVSGRPQCVCPETCAEIYSPVCGSDGVTYENECALRRKSCKNETGISVVKRGKCEKPKCPPTFVCLAICDKAKCEKQGKLCCCTGSCTSCRTPVFDNSGQKVCPPDPLSCRNDADCSAGKTCCPDGCTTRCKSLKLAVGTLKNST